MATLYINRSDSRCGNCGKNADPYELRHETVYAPQEGCRELFTAVSSDYDMITAADVARMRPDLPWVDWGF